MIARMIGVLRLDPHLFEEIERDPEATNQAFMIVVLSGIAGAIGNVREDAAGIAAGATSQLAGWSLFALLAWVVGSRVFATPETSASWSELARTLGFAYTPTLLGVLGFIPVVGALATAVGLIWFTIAAVVAMRHALDFTTGRAIATGAVCLVAYVLIGVVIALTVGAALTTGA